MIPLLPSGLVVERLHAPRLGQLYLVESARRQVERLYVAVLDGDPSTLTWLRARAPDAEVFAMAPDDAGDALRARLPAPIREVFGSGPDARRVASVLGARWLPLHAETAVAVGLGADARRDRVAPAAPRRTRAYGGVAGAEPPLKESASSHEDALRRATTPLPPSGLAVRVAIVGPESTGKSTLAARLATIFGGTVVPEHAEALLAAEVCDRHALRPRDFEDFARGQIASEDALAALRGGLLLCDSDPLTTQLYAEALVGACPDGIAEEARRRRYDLTLLSDPGVPWEDAPHRVDPAGREAFFARMRDALERLGRRYVVLEGDWESRFRTAADAVARVNVGRP